METLIVNSLSLLFFNFLIIKAEIFNNQRNFIKNFLKKRIVSGQGQDLENFILYVLQCPFCLTFWISLILSIPQLFPVYGMFVYPVIVKILWKHLDQPT